MGCDIHMFVEKKVDDHWEAAYGRDLWLDTATNPEYIKTHSAPSLNWLYDGRNYSLFALLAGVRNRWDFDPIDEPRDIPEGVSEEIAKEYESWGWDAHSASYFYLDELQDYRDNNTSKFFMNSGVVNLIEYREYLEKGYPTCYCQYISGPNVVIISNEEMMANVRGIMNTEGSLYTKIYWIDNLFEDTGLDEIVKELEKYATENEVAPEDLRMVFWFDN